MMWNFVFLIHKKGVVLLDAAEYKCPNCNADLKFDPTTQKLTCEYCESSYTVEEIREIYADLQIPQEQAQQQAAIEDDFAEHTNLYHCSSCGADIMAEEGQTALFCYYCHNPVILSGKLAGSFKPDKVIGFKITRDSALDMFKKWCEKRKFLPNDFKSEQQLEKMTGLYVPFWVADCDVKADYSGIGKNIRTWSSGGYRYTEIKEFKVERHGNIYVSGVPADGESKIEDLLMESIEPFDYSELKDFDMSYLSGFYADKYDVDKVAVFPRVKERVTKAGKDVMKSTFTNYNSVSPNIETYNIRSTKWQYMMLPVWFMSYKYGDKIYEFALNGQTGKLAGTPPLDEKKLNIFCMGICAAVTLIGFILGGTGII